LKIHDPCVLPQVNVYLNMHARTLNQI